MSYVPDPRVDEYIAALPQWQQFVLEGNICAVLAAKDHING